jgi:hypothetical protein
VFSAVAPEGAMARLADDLGRIVESVTFPVLRWEIAR